MRRRLPRVPSIMHPRRVCRLWRRRSKKPLQLSLKRRKLRKCCKKSPKRNTSIIPFKPPSWSNKKKRSSVPSLRMAIWLDSKLKVMSSWLLGTPQREIVQFSCNLSPPSKSNLSPTPTLINNSGMRSKLLLTKISRKASESPSRSTVWSIDLPAQTLTIALSPSLIGSMRAPFNVSSNLTLAKREFMSLRVSMSTSTSLALRTQRWRALRTVIMKSLMDFSSGLPLSWVKLTPTLILK